MPSTLQFHRSSDEADTAALIRDMMALDRELYGEIGEEHLGGFDYWCERFGRCPEFLSVARKPDGVLAGYYQFVPVAAAFREEILAGRAKDGQIPLEAIVPYSGLDAPFHLYLCSMAVRPEYRQRGVATRLYREEGIFQRGRRARGGQLRSLCTVIWSPCGGRFFERLGLPRIGFDEGGRAIHCRELPGGELPELPVPGVRQTMVAVAA